MQIGIVIIWRYWPQQSLPVHFSPNDSNKSITTISLIIYDDIHTQLNPIIRKRQPTWQAICSQGPHIRPQTLDLIRHMNCIWYSKLLFKQPRSSILRHIKQPRICARGKTYLFSVLHFSLKKCINDKTHISNSEANRNSLHIASKPNSGLQSHLFYHHI